MGLGAFDLAFDLLIRPSLSLSLFLSFSISSLSLSILRFFVVRIDMQTGYFDAWPVVLGIGLLGCPGVISLGVVFVNLIIGGTKGELDGG